MSKTNFTAQTETIDTNYDMLNYFYYKQAFNSDEIKKIVLICEKLDSEIIKHNDSHISSDDKRRDTISYLPLNDETSWIYDKIYNLSIEANQDMGWNFDIDSINEHMEYSTYTNNSGHYLWYSDIASSNNNKLSVTLHLSLEEEYSGGHTEFNSGYEISQPKFSVGDVVITPSYLLQRVTPILSGVKRTINLSITGKSFK